MSDSTNPPTYKMLEFAKKLATTHKLVLPDNASTSFDACKAFLDEHAELASKPSENQLSFADSIAEKKGVQIPAAVKTDRKMLSAWIDENK